MAAYELTPEEMKLFLQEGYEQIELMEQGLLELESEPDNSQTVQEIFRAAHTLKGGAATAGLTGMEQLTHVLESLLDEVRDQVRPVTTQLIDELLDAVDVLLQSLQTIDAGGSADDVDVTAIVDHLTNLLQYDAPEEDEALQNIEQQAIPEQSEEHKQESPSLEKQYPKEGTKFLQVVVTVAADELLAPVRLYQTYLVVEQFGDVVRTNPSIDELENGDHHDTLRVVIQTRVDIEQVQKALAEVPSIEMTQADYVEYVNVQRESDDASTKSPADDNAKQKTNIGKQRRNTGATNVTNTIATSQTVRVSVEVLDRLMNLVGELVIDRTRLSRLATIDMPTQHFQEELEQVSGHLTRITTDLQDSIMSARMVPLSTLFRKFPRMIRDVSRQLGKDVVFEMSGEDTELDRSVVEQIGDPLMHLLRNAVDHGLEMPEEREAKNKRKEGHLYLRAYHQENHIFIEVEDDGKGMDPEKIRNTALRKGLVTEEELQQLNDDEIIELILLPGFSTADEVSSISGRGVGLDVVRKNIERVNGHVAVQSEPNEGTQWRIKLPLTLAIVQALLVEIKDEVYALPIANVVEAMRVTKDQLEKAHGWYMLRVRDEVIPLINPADVWGDIHRVEWNDAQPLPVVVLQAGFAPVALMVDRLIGEQEVVIKNMGPLIGEIPGISGASILGDGRVSLIIDVGGLSKGVRQIAGSK